MILTKRGALVVSLFAMILFIVVNYIESVGV